MALACAIGFVSPAQAGRNCETPQPGLADVQRALALAERTSRALDASGADVVVLARAGQDLSTYRLRWSHIGLAYRESSALGDGTTGVWRVVHKLNQCGSARSDIYRQGLGAFFLDDLYEYRTAFSVLSPDVQRQLLPLLVDNRRAMQLHEPAYSMVAYPWALSYQQSNQWVIETLALSQSPDVHTRQRAQAWLRMHDYEPTALNLSPLTRLGARATAANVAFDDHPDHKRFGNRIETVTADSVFDWLARSGLGSEARELR
jgi:hypothetical protein